MTTRNGRLAGKVALVTGAGSGIARASAKLFSAEGAKIVIAEIKPELGRETERIIRETGGDALFVETDVTKDESVRNAIAQTVQSYGQLNILYSCAGGSIPEDGPAPEVDLSVWEHTIPFDLFSAFLCARHGIPEIIKAGGGAVINMTSSVALIGITSQHVYISAKGGIIALTKSLAGDYARQGVRVNAIAPGWVRTGRGTARADSPLAKKWIGLLETHPNARGEPEDLANIALFLASDESRMITGVIIPADGGLSAFL